MSVEVQCQLAATSLDLVMEVIAMRAKISEMKQSSARLKDDLRDEIRKDYEGLVQNLVASIFALRTKFHEFR